MHQILISQHFCTFCGSLAVDGRTRLLYLCFNHEQQGTVVSLHVQLMCCRLISTLRSGKNIELLIYLVFFFVDILNCETLPHPQSRAESVEPFRIHFYCFCYPQSWWNSPKAAFMPPERRSTGHFIFNGPSLVLTGTSSVLLVRSALLFFALGRIISDSEPVDFPL